MPRPSVAPSAARETARLDARWRRLLRDDRAVLLLCVAWSLAVAPFAPGFVSTANLHNLVIGLLPLLVVATGQTFVLIAGGIDLSVAAVVGLASVTGASLVTADGPGLFPGAWAMPAGCAAMLAVGAAVGAANGVAVAWLRMPPFIVTLATMMFAGGLAAWSTRSNVVGGLPASFTNVGARLASSAVLVAGAVWIGHLALTRTLFGRWIYAVGHNPRTAAVSGVPVKRVTCLVYVVCGIGAALAAILYTGRLESGSPVHGQNLLLDVIGATVIGGTSLYGGRGRISGTILGAIFLTLIDNSLNLLNLSHFAIMMVKGAVILIAAAIDAMRERSLQT